MSKISDFLMTGRDNAIPMADLASMLNLPERAVRREILEARLRGELILANEQGYFLSTDPDDLREYVIKKKAFIKTASAALKPFIKAIR